MLALRFYPVFQYLEFPRPHLRQAAPSGRQGSRKRGQTHPPAAAGSFPLAKIVPAPPASGVPRQVRTLPRQRVLPAHGIREEQRLPPGIRDPA